MKGLRKRYLVTSEQLNSLKAQQHQQQPYRIRHPNATAAGNDMEKLRKIQESTEMSDYDKVLNYDQRLRKYLNNLEAAVTIPKAKALVGSNASFTIQPPPPPPADVKTPEVKSVKRPLPTPRNKYEMTPMPNFDTSVGRL